MFFISHQVDFETQNLYLPQKDFVFLCFCSPTGGRAELVSLDFLFHLEQILRLEIFTCLRKISWFYFSTCLLMAKLNQQVQANFLISSKFCDLKHLLALNNSFCLFYSPRKRRASNFGLGNFKFKLDSDESYQILDNSYEEKIHQIIIQTLNLT